MIFRILFHVWAIGAMFWGAVIITANEIAAQAGDERRLSLWQIVVVSVVWPPVAWKILKELGET